MQKQPTAAEVENEIIKAAEYMGEKVKNAEIAFFGGSFTAIDRKYMLSLLEVAHTAVKKYGFLGIRCSTRPDAIDEEILDILKAHSVTAIELGAQSMIDRVLFMNDRGHTSEDVVKASALIKSFGFELGLQMMTGLYASSAEDDMQTVDKLISLHPDTVRIYPTITLGNTKLAELYGAGEYKPQSLNEAVELCSEIIPLFEKEGIRVIRVGLHASEELDCRVAGPYHPAFRELCNSEMLYKEISNKMTPGKEYTVRCNKKLHSAIVGQKKNNLLRWEKNGFGIRVRTDETVKDYIVEEM